MKKTLVSLLIFAPLFAFAQVDRIGSQCYLENVLKTPAAAACVAALRAEGKKVTEGDYIQCNIQTGLLTPTKCPENNK